MKATIAVLGFILSSAAKHNVDSESLSSELQQLGLPKGGGTLGLWRRDAPGSRAWPQQRERVCFLSCLPTARPGRALQRAVPLLRGEAELPPGQAQGLQPEA